MLEYISGTGKVILKSEIGIKLAFAIWYDSKKQTFTFDCVGEAGQSPVLVLSAVTGQCLASLSMPHSCIIVRLEPDGRKGRWRTLGSARLDMRRWGSIPRSRPC